MWKSRFRTEVLLLVVACLAGAREGGAAKSELGLDFYAALELPRTAGETEIKKAFRKLAVRFHPDLHPGDAAAESRFKTVNEAAEAPLDPIVRERYDRFIRQNGRAPERSEIDLRGEYFAQRDEELRKAQAAQVAAKVEPAIKHEATELEPEKVSRFFAAGDRAKAGYRQLSPQEFGNGGKPAERGRHRPEHRGQPQDSRH